MKQATIEQSTKQRNHAAIGSRIAEMRRRISQPGYVEARLDGAIDNLIASGDLAMESTPRTEAVCCVCHSPLNSIAYQTASGWACYFCGAEDQRQSLDDPDGRVEHAERWDGMN